MAIQPIRNYALLTIVNATEQDVQAFHDIRHAELFAGRGIEYNPKHPDDWNINRKRLVFYLNKKVIGVATLDLLPSPIIETAALRLVAITRNEQGKGHGRVLMQKIEEFARRHDTQLLLLNARLATVIFYEKLGYQLCEWRDNKRESSGVRPMAKLLLPRLLLL